MIFFLLFAALFPVKQENIYRIYNKDGREVSGHEFYKKAVGADVILFGEIHNNTVAHFLQQKLAEKLFDEKKEKLVIGAEMFEADDQIVIDEYFEGLFEYRHFQKEVKLWPNFETDYKAVFEFCREKHLKFIATNCPRRYASMVAMHGLDSLNKLSAEARTFIAEIPFPVDLTLPGYAAMKEMGEHGPMKFMAEAQALKDASMAHFILKNYKKDQIFLHLNGAYHSNNYEGICWYLRKKDSELKVVTIAVTEQDKIESLEEESKGIADFIIVTDKSFPKTH